MEDQNQNQNSENGKVKKRYENALRSTIALLGSEEKLQQNNKVKNKDLAEMVEDLFEEESAANKENFKKELKLLITKKAEFDRFLREEKAKMEKAVSEKMKEFAEAAERLFKKVEDMPLLLKSYYDSANEILEAAAGKEEMREDGK